MQPYEDPQSATDLALSLIEAEIERLPKDLTHYRDRAADIAERLRDQANNTPRRQRHGDQH